MKKIAALPIIIMLCTLILSSCELLSQDYELKTLQVSSEAIFEQYHIFIEYSNTPSESEEIDNNRFISTFDIFSKNDEGTEVDRVSVNGTFDFTVIDLEENPNIILTDYNKDRNPDFAIGFPSSTGASEWMYILFTINDKGEISRLPVRGYKEDDYIYSKNCAVFPKFTSGIFGDSKKLPCVFVGVEQDGIFRPARYVWKDETFVFEQDLPFIVSQEITPNFQNVSIVQTVYKHPKMPSDEDFSMFESFISGEFELVVSNKDGIETSRINLNSLFDGKDLGWGGGFPIVFRDYNADGDVEFAFGQNLEDSPEFQYILISISKDGIVYPLEARGYKDSPYIYHSSYDGYFKLLDQADIGFSVMVNDGGWSFGEYIWDNETEEFVFRKSKE